MDGRYVLALFCAVVAASAAHAEFLAGTARASITPLEAGIPTQLGGYGERNGQPATGIHDTIYAKVIVMKSGDTLAALVGLDICTTPWSLLEDTDTKAAIPGLTTENVLLSASHDHGGLEGMAMDRNNVLGNPHIGIFSEAMLNFVSDRVAAALKEAAARLEPVTAGTGVAPLRGMNRNRRHEGAPTDEDMTVLRLDRANGTPLAVVVNYTAHGTIMTEKEMEISGDWAGAMQRTLEDLIGGDVTCVYTNGSEGDVAPQGYTGGSRYEMAEQYGRRVGIAADKLTEAIRTGPVEHFAILAQRVALPPKQASPDFMKIAGQEYGTGSSRDWAAKGTNLLGVKVVVAQSFERIHRSNLVGMGVLPLQFKDGTTAQTLKLDGTETYDTVGLDANLKPQQDLTLKITRKDGSVENVPVRCRIDTPIEIDYYQHGGILPYVLRQLIARA